jgi:putative membrane protein
MTTGYLWLKAIHIVGVVCWFAGLFYLPRLFVYHAMTEDAAGRARFAVMEEKLYRIIMRPAMLVAIIFGTWMLLVAWDSFATSGWLWVKLAAVVLLLGYHHYCGRLVRAFAAGSQPHTERFLRMFNEAPVLILLLIVVLVVVKPF